ncbi:MAG TPA: proline dehydrogenase family protein [Propionicimonas sp.]|nr:proline dehydrogenase family protein [Propionicimonas sp.]
MLRGLLLAAAGSARLRRWVTALPPTRAVVARFIAGDTLADGIDAARSLASRGLDSTIDVLGEHTDTLAQAQAATASYLDLLQRVHEAGLAGSVEVSLKLTALGAGLPGAPGSDSAALAEANARRICAAAAAIGTTVTLDAEDHTTTDTTLAIAGRLRPDFPDLGVVLQAALFRTPLDADRLGGPGARVRLCKGAYAEPATLAWQRREEVNAAYLRVLGRLFAAGACPLVASHDPELIAAAPGLATASGRTADDYEHQFLYGIRTDEQLALAAAGRRVRIYVPCGTDWWAYFMRRLAERPANLGFFLRALVGR